MKTRRLFCPTSQARLTKIFFFPKYRSYDLKKSSRAHKRARRDRHERRERDAMDAIVPQDVRQERVRSSRVVLIPRRWDQVCRDDRQTTGASKPGTPRRARSKP